MNALTFFRIKPGITDPDDIIEERGRLKHSNVKVGSTRIGDLYVKRVQRSSPEWMEYFGSSIDLSGVSLTTASLSAVLLMKRDDSMYAVVFGYGRSLLKEGVVEDRFGLRATLNAVDPSQLRSIDHKRLEVVSRHSREELSGAGTLDQFGLDIDRDLLRAVTGSPADASYGHRLSGADHLTVIANIPLASLGDRLETYRQLAEQKIYVENFPWVDNVREVHDGLLRLALDRQLAKDLVRGSTECWLSPPDIIDWSTTEGFRYRQRESAQVFADLDLDDYFAEYGSRRDLTEARLRSERIYHVRSEDSSGQRSWAVIRCLVGECKYRSKRYILNEGKWYEVDEGFLQTVEDFTQNIPQPKIKFPSYGRTDNGEGAYNKRVANGNKKYFALLDQDFITYPRRGKIEVCDLYTADRTFIHVKRCGASSTLSHLFAQGTVSAQLMVSEPQFRGQFHQKLPATHHWGSPDDAIRAGDFEICFAIVCRPQQPLSLPFFSKVNLRAAVRLLRQLGFRVSLASISSL